MDEEMTTRQPKRNPRDRKYVQSVDLGPKKVDIEKFAQGVPKHRATSAMARSKALYKQGTANKILYRSTAFQKDWFLTVFIGTVIFAWAVCSRAQKWNYILEYDLLHIQEVLIVYYAWNNIVII